MRYVIKSFLKFTRCDKGGIMIIGAIALLVLVIAAGIAIDMSRMQTAKTELYGCLDTAGLAAMAKITTPGTESVPAWVAQNVQTYFLADCRSHYLQTSSVAFTSGVAATASNSININLSPDYSTLTLDARLNEATEFMPVIGIKTVQVTAHSVISRSTGGLELALVLDNTGSMSGPVDPTASSVPKITALKCALAGDAAAGSGVCDNNASLASIGLLDILYGSNASQSNLFTGVVPFSDMVNVNATVLPGLGFIDTVWTGRNVRNPNGCVDSRSGVYPSVAEPGLTIDIADDIPKFSPALPDGNGGPGQPPVDNQLMFQALPASGNNFCPPAYVHFMSPTKSDAVAAIHEMQPNGDTMLPMGLAWGWRMLSPNWTGLWGSATYTAPNGNNLTLPLPYNTQGMTKVVVFMTDGMNHNGSGSDSTNTNGSDSNDAYDVQPTPVPANAGYPDGMPTNTQLDNLTLEVCNAMKAKGIIIYTIGFGQAAPDNPPSNRDRENELLVDAPLLQSCAANQGSQPHYFLAPTNAALATAFQTIAGQLSNLVVSQ